MTRIRELTGDGVDVVLDGIGGKGFDRLLPCAPPGRSCGRLVLFGHDATLVEGIADKQVLICDEEAMT